MDRRSLIHYFRFTISALVLAPLLSAETPKPLVENLAATEIAARLAENKKTSGTAGHQPLVIVDVRTPAEFASGHIEGAKNIDVSSADFEAKITSLATAEKGKTIVLHCKSGGRSSRALSTIEKAGFSKVLHMKDGFMAWAAAKLPVAK